jgi:hypothetical protein
MNVMAGHEQFIRLWTEAQPVVAAYINALVADFQQANISFGSRSHSPGQIPGILVRSVLRRVGHRHRQIRGSHGPAPSCPQPPHLLYQPDLLDRITETYEELAPELENRARALHDCLQQIHGRARELLRLRYEQSLKPGAIAATSRYRRHRCPRHAHSRLDFKTSTCQG